MMKLMICLLVSLGTLVGCLSSEHRLLRQVDGLIDGGRADSAAALLATICPEKISTDADRAYYELLKVAANSELNCSWGNGDLIKKWSVDLENDRLLAMAYHYDACYARQRGDVRMVFGCEKTAMTYAQEADDDWLKYRITETMSRCQRDNGNWKLSLEYDHERLGYARQLDNKQWVTQTMSSMAINFACMQQADSARYYLKQVLPLMKKMDREHQALTWQAQGLLALNQPKQAELYFKNALKCHEQTATYLLLADLYIRQGRYELAENEWQKIERKATETERTHIMKAKYQHALQTSDEARAKHWAAEIIALQDSLSEKHQCYVAKMEDECAEAVEDGMNSYIELLRFYRLIGGITLIILCILAFVYVYCQWTKLRMKTMNQRVNTLKEVECKAKKEIRRLSRDVVALRSHHAKRIAEGRRCYEHIKRGDTVVKWQKMEFESFMEYYRTQDPDFVLHLETDYDRLSAKLQFFETLYHLGYTDQQVAATMGITDSTIRANKSRIRAKGIKTDTRQ